MRPSTTRTSRVSASSSLSSGGIVSTSRIVPSSVSNSVSSTSVFSRYRRRTAVTGAVGAIRQCPSSSVPSSREKHDGESNRGMHNQSTDPSRPTSAAVLRSESSA